MNVSKQDVRSSFFSIAISFALEICFLAAPAHAGCAKTMARLSGGFLGRSDLPMISRPEYEALRDKRIAEYFPVSEGEGRARPLRETRGSGRVPKPQKEALAEAVDRFLRAHEKYTGEYYYEKEFRSWWQTYQAGYMNRRVVEGHRDESTTLGRFVEELHDDFMDNRTRPGLLTRARKAVTSPYFLGAAAASTGIFALQQLRMYASFGIGMGAFLAFFSQPNARLQRHAREMGDQVFGVDPDFAEDGQSNLQESEEILLELELLTQAVGRIAPDALLQRWKRLEEKMYRHSVRLSLSFAKRQKQLKEFGSLSDEHGGLSPSETDQKHRVGEELKKIEEAMKHRVEVQQKLFAVHRTLEQALASSAKAAADGIPSEDDGGMPLLPPKLPRP